LISWWPGDGTASDIVGANNGVLEGGATASAPGFVGPAFSFDGTNSFVQIPDSPSLHPASLTIEAWVLFSSLNSAASGGSPAGSQYIVFKQNSQTYNFEGFDLGKTRLASGDVFQFLVTSASAQTAETYSTTLLTTNVWYHVAAVRGTNFIQIYVNGQLQGQTSVAFAQNYGSLPLYFGTSGESYWDHKFAGSLDEVSLYNRALASNEVAAIYAAGAAGKCKAASGATITAQPRSQTVAVGSNALFAVTAGGTAPLGYQWQFNNTAIPSATNTSLTLANVQSTQAGNYTVIVTNSTAAATSAVAVLTVLVPPAIGTQPASQSVVAGANVSFSVTASGAAPLGYQWQFNNTAIPSATNTSLTLANVQPAQAGNYAVIVANAAALVTSAVAVLTVQGPPAIVTQPASQNVAAAANVSFSVTASGTAPLSYQWKFNGANLSGATGTSLALTGVQPANAGNYTVVVTNSAASITSAAAVLTVTPAAGTVTINGAVTYQVIDGFGANINHRSWNNTELEPVLNALINQAGFTLFHVIFDNNNWEAVNDNNDADVMNWTYYDSIYSAPDFQKLWGIMAYLNQQGITNGLVPDFEGPVALWMGGLSLTPGYEDEYAETIASLLVYARNTEHLQFNTVGPVNEPDITYSGINMSGPAQYVTVMQDLSQQLDNKGMSDVRFSGPDLANTSTGWLGQIMANPALMAKYAHFGLHSYQNETGDATGVYNFIQSSAYPNTHFWMTEYNVWCPSCLYTTSGASGNDTWAYAQSTASYLLTLLAEGASAGIVWEGYDSEYYPFNASTGGNDPAQWSYWGLFAVDDINATPKTYTARKGFYTLAQIAKFVRPGAQRINVSGSVSPLTLLAFYNTNSGQLTLTGVNTTGSASSLSCALTSLPSIPSLELYYTTSTTNLCDGGPVTVNNGAFSVVIPASSVFTLTYSNTAAPLALSQPGLTMAEPYFLPPTVQNGIVTLTLVGQSGSSCLIEGSPDSESWTEVTNVTILNGTVTITEPVGAGAQFYRAILLQ
jgi:O-glycosyl hydrolase